MAPCLAAPNQLVVPHQIALVCETTSTLTIEDIATRMDWAHWASVPYPKQISDSPVIHSDYEFAWLTKLKFLLFWLSITRCLTILFCTKGMALGFKRLVAPAIHAVRIIEKSLVDRRYPNWTLAVDRSKRFTCESDQVGRCKYPSLSFHPINCSSARFDRRVEFHVTGIRALVHMLEISDRTERNF